MLPVLYNLSSIFSLLAKACLIVLTETKRAVAEATALNGMLKYLLFAVQLVSERGLQGLALQLAVGITAGFVE